MDDKALLRAEKYCEALESENEGLHFRLWRSELKETESSDDDGPPQGWSATRAD